ncbi:MAG: acyl--CoA ligase [Eubacterium sp.]|nr:acyl--CoA ligase [Eubacterium sp.]
MSSNVRTHLEYPPLTMFQMIERIARRYPDEPAYELYGRKTSYAGFVRRIERAARAFLAMGISRDDRVTICMPNTPQALDCFYALNRIGAAANMIHPQSAVREITFYLNLSESKAILTLDLFAEPVEQAVAAADHPVTILIARMQEELPPHLAALYLAKAGRHYLKYPNTDHAMLWKTFLRKGT